MNTVEIGTLIKRNPHLTHQFDTMGYRPVLSLNQREATFVISIKSMSYAVKVEAHIVHGTDPAVVECLLYGLMDFYKRMTEIARRIKSMSDDTFAQLMAHDYNHDTRQVAYHYMDWGLSLPQNGDCVRIGYGWLISDQLYRDLAVWKRGSEQNRRTFEGILGHTNKI